MTELVVQHLTKTFAAPWGRSLRSLGRGSAPATVAVDDVSFTLHDGESLGLVGESGSGKSTIARILVGLEQAGAGTVTLDGRDRTRPPRGSRDRLRRAREVQLVFQDPYSSLDNRVSPARCLERVLELHGWRDRSQRADRAVELLAHVGLGTREATASPRRLSGGQRQRLAIARALAVNPRVLVLDEPVAALDVSIQAQVLQLVADIRREEGMGCIFVSHDLAVVRQVTDRVLVMRKGRVVESGRTEQVLADPQHPYTQLLLASVPKPGWDPSVVSRLRETVAAAEHGSPNDERRGR